MQVCCVQPTPELRATFAGTALSSQNIIYFSTRGPRALADQLSGGDYDGDRFLVISNPALVEAFLTESEPWEEPLSSRGTKSALAAAASSEQHFHRDDIFELGQARGEPRSFGAFGFHRCRGRWTKQACATAKMVNNADWCPPPPMGWSRFPQVPELFFTARSLTNPKRWVGSFLKNVNLKPQFGPVTLQISRTVIFGHYSLWEFRSE